MIWAQAQKTFNLSRIIIENFVNENVKMMKKMLKVLCSNLQRLWSRKFDLKVAPYCFLKSGENEYFGKEWN